MQEEDIARDPSDKVSGQLRKAVGLNRHEIGGLRSVVSQMKRERNKSVGLLSKQQQDFLQKQARLLPALNAKKKFKKTANQVIPLNHEQMGLPIESPKVVSPKLGISGISSSQFNVLPPIRSNGRVGGDHSMAETDAKQQRISDYQKEFSSLQESIHNAHRFASGSVNENQLLQETKRARLNTEDESVLGVRKKQGLHLQSLTEQEEDINEGKREHTRTELILYNKDSSKSQTKKHGLRSKEKEMESQFEIDMKTKTRSVVKTISSFDEVEKVALANKPAKQSRENSIIYEEEETTKQSYWNIVRKRLGIIAAMNKKRHSQYLEQLYEEIRKCRYIRRPRRRNPSTGLWYESGEESDQE